MTTPASGRRRARCSSSTSSTVVGEAGDGAGALLARWRGSAPEVVLLDIGLPDMSGFDVAERITSPRRTTVVLISSRSPDQVSIRLHDCGAVGFIAKDDLSGAALEARRGGRADERAAPRRAAPSTREPALVRAAGDRARSRVVLLLVPIAWLDLVVPDDSRDRNPTAPHSPPSAVAGILTAAGVGAFLAVRRPANAVGWLLIGLGRDLGAARGSLEQYGDYGLLHPQRRAPLARRGRLALGQQLVVDLRVARADRRVLPRGAPRVAHAPGPRRRRRSSRHSSSASSASPPRDVSTRRSRTSRPRSASSAAPGRSPRSCASSASSPASSVPRSTSSSACGTARGVERRQLVCFAYGALLVPLSIAVCLAFAGTRSELGDMLVLLSLAAAIIILPLATAIAILRYQLYAIDRIVNRTVVYSLHHGAARRDLSPVLVILLTRLFATVLHDPSSFAIALATVFVTAAFLPVRARVQRAVDRRFAGAASRP